jgi:uncharacterized membrane protein
MRPLGLLDLATLVCAVGSGVVGGFFLAFSVCVMRTLGALPPAQGIAAMQSINVVVLNPWFLVPFVGTAAGCAGVLIGSLVTWQLPASACATAGSALYLLGNLAVTRAFNIPLNDALAKATAGSPEALALWNDYLVTWTAWNHVRTITAVLAALLLATALLCRA